MIEPGTLLQNRYRVTRQIGRGGMGAVYVATDERFNSTVAVKQTFFYDDPMLRRAFEREAVLLNHLRHAALPRVSDHFTEGEGQFLVMEYVEGSDLGELLKARGGWFPVADVLAWADELLDALEYLHAQDPPVVHRDIKPQNIKRTRQGRMVLLDFGLAKGTPSSVTMTGSLLGYSPHYAPLEQVQGTGTDVRSDIYSLGATLYHLLTGEPPVDALTRAAAVVNNEADPLRPAHVVRPEVPVAVSRVVRRAMAQKAALRPKSAAEMREALRQAAGAAAQTSPAAQGSTREQHSHVEATVVDSLTKAAGSVPSYYFGETTLNGARGASSYSTDAPSHFDAGPERRSFGATAKLLVAAAVVAVCAAVAFPLLSAGGPETKPAPVPATTQAAESPAGAETEVPPAKRPNSSSEKTSAAASTAPTPSGSSEVSEPQTTSTAAGEPKPAATAQSPSPVIVVVNPTPTPAASTADEYDEAQRRALEERRRQQQAAPPPGGQPPPGGPPPFGGPPPPPPGGGPAPPPTRRPPY